MLVQPVLHKQRRLFDAGRPFLEEKQQIVSKERGELNNLFVMLFDISRQFDCSAG